MPANAIESPISFGDRPRPVGGAPSQKIGYSEPYATLESWNTRNPVRRRMVSLVNTSLLDAEGLLMLGSNAGGLEPACSSSSSTFVDLLRVTSRRKYVGLELADMNCQNQVKKVPSLSPRGGKSFASSNVSSKKIIIKIASIRRTTAENRFGSAYG